MNGLSYARVLARQILKHVGYDGELLLVRIRHGRLQPVTKDNVAYDILVNNPAWRNYVTNYNERRSQGEI